MRDDGPVNTTRAALLEPRVVGDVEGEFFVRDYQRGYRWGQDEVRRLLEDIKDAGTENYFLQPVVVKRREDGRWELVDGQQRLTTLYLVLHYIQRHMPTAEVRYSLTYETRPDSAAYLDSPTEDASFDNIDYFHIYQALRNIESWFGEQPNETLAAIELFTALSKTVFLIWYEAPDTAEFDSRTLFTRLNVGRIPLTDAELVKALLLTRVQDKYKHEIAAQWDSIERELHGPEVWGFATATADGGPTRISLLLDTVADISSGGSARADRPLYHTFETLRPEIEASPEDLWDKVVDLHSLVLGWYDDRNLFHKIGYVIAAGGSTFLDLVVLAQTRTKSEFDSALRELIRASLNLSRSGVASLTYGLAKTRAVLLLMNVETVRRQHALLRALLVRCARAAPVVPGAHPCPELTGAEHCRAMDCLAARAPEGTRRARPSRSGARRDYGADRRGAADHHQRDLRAAPPRAHAALHRRRGRRGRSSKLPVRDATTRWTRSPTSRCWRATTTASLNNAVFEVKRRHVIALRPARLLHPGLHPQRLPEVLHRHGRPTAPLLGPRDRQSYLDAMLEVLDPYLLDDVPENDVLEELEESRA